MLNKCITYMSFMFFVGFLSVGIKKMYHIDDSKVGFLNLAMTISYTISCIMMPLFFKECPRRLLFTIAFYICAFGLILVSNSPMFGIPKSLTIVVAGMVIAGGAQGPNMVFALPEAIDTFKIFHKHRDGVNPILDNLISDKFATLHSFLVNLTCMVAPIAGGYLYDNYGYHRAFDTCAILVFVGANLNLFHNCGFHPFAEQEEDKTELTKLQSQ